MLHKLTGALANSGLLAVVLLLVAGPLVLGSMIVTNQTGSLGAATSRPEAADVTQPVISVVPNTTDFQQYAQFGTPQSSQNTYQTSVTFTAFAGQIASYNGLISVANTSAQAQKLSVAVGKVSGELSHSRLWLTLSPEGKLATSLLTQAAKVGDQQLTVSDSSGLTGGQIVVGTTPMSATVAGATQLHVGQALPSAFGVGEKVYYGPAYFLNSATPTYDTTQTIELQPQQRAAIDMVVATDAGQPAQAQAVLPIVISVLQ